jgi:hypothetical protein
MQVSVLSFADELPRLTRDPCPVTPHHALLWPATGRVLMLVWMQQGPHAAAEAAEPSDLMCLNNDPTPLPPPLPLTKLAFRFRTPQGAKECFGVLSVRPHPARHEAPAPAPRVRTSP